MKNMKHISWTRLLRSMMALMLVVAMLLCGGCGKKPSDETTNPNALGDGDGKLEAQDFVDGFTKLYGTLLTSMGGQTAASSGSEMDITLTLGEDILSYLSATMESGGLPSDVSWLKQIGIGMDVNYTQGLTQMGMELSLGETGIVSAEMIMDTLNNMLYVALPELSDQYIGSAVDFSDVTGSYQQMMGQMSSYTELVNALPTETELNTLLNRYLNILLEHLQEPTSATETLSHGGVSQEVTATTYTIRRSHVLNMVEAVLKAAQTDAELEKMLDDIAKFYNEQGAKDAAEGGYTWYDEDLHQNMLDSIADTLEELEETRTDLEDGDCLIFTFYTDDNAPVGFRLSAQSDSEGGEIYLYSLTNGNNTAFIVDLAGVQIAGTGTSKNGKADGKYTLTAEGMEMAHLEVKELDTEALKQGELKATLRLSMSNEMIEQTIGPNAVITSATVIEMVLNTNGNNGTVAYNLYSGSAFILGISVSTKVVDAESIQLPTDYADAENSAEMEAWGTAIDLEKILQNLRQAGVPEELLNKLLASLGDTTK